ncbi:MAG: amino acid permease [Candidatus Auribacterota bacterium]
MSLKKQLNLLDVFCLATGAMISSGLFILPGLAHARAGTGVILSYIIAGILAMTGMFSVIELSTAMPRAGGDYFYITRSMGPAVGTVAGLLSWLALTLKSAFALIGMAAFTTRLIPVDIHIIAILLCLIFMFINIIGVQAASRIQVILVVGLLCLIGVFLFRGFEHVNIHNLVPFAPHGVTAIFSTAGFVFVSYGGLLKIASIAEEIKDPGTTIPRAMTISLFVVIMAYALVIFIAVGTLETAHLNQSITPISDSAASFMAKGGRLALDIAAILAFITTANAGILSASRYPLALGRDEMIPSVFKTVGKRFNTPHVAILATGIVMIFFLLLRLEILIEAASTVLILSYMLSSLSIIILRESRVENYRPKFKSPLYPWPQLLGFFGFAFLIFEMGMEAIGISMILIIAGFFAYWFYGRIRSTRESALLHLVARITAKELSTRGLESELKDIIQERDEITKDRFDQLVENCIVIDKEKRGSMEALFHEAAQVLSERMHLDKKDLFDLLVAREQESSTVITPSLAIPHIIVSGKHVFDILIVRCADGISFPQSNDVKAVFFLVGSKDERNFHLRALSSIAQIVQNPRFEKRWMSARNTESLRDVILLGERKRYTHSE